MFFHNSHCVRLSQSYRFPNDYFIHGCLSLKECTNHCSENCKLFSIFLITIFKKGSKTSFLNETLLGNSQRFI